MHPLSIPEILYKWLNYIMSHLYNVHRGFLVEPVKIILFAKQTAPVIPMANMNYRLLKPESFLPRSRSSDYNVPNGTFLRPPR